MIEKIEDFLYDVLGLVLPGFMFIAIIVSLPVCFIDIDKYNSSYSIHNILLVNICNKFEAQDFASTYVIIIILLLSYILGHVIKVFSKYQYSLFTSIFDNGFNKFIKHVIENLEKINHIPFKFLKKDYRNDFNNRKRWYVGLVNIIIGIFSFCTKFLKDILSFSSPSYYIENESIQKDVVNKINAAYNTNFPDSWYSVYKIANVIMAQEEIESMAEEFLIKYNFYRSMAFLFLFNFFYTVIFFSKYNGVINSIGHELFFTLCIVTGILWLTFHEKYKRYWTLCGNESLMALFYFLSKP